jgi:hypothetical protein
LGHWKSYDGGRVQDLAWEQFVRETAHWMSEVLSPRPRPAANQGTGQLYSEIRSKLCRGLDLPTIGKKIFFVDLVERIVKELNVSNCWGCTGTLISEEWPWKGTSLNDYQLLLRN